MQIRKKIKLILKITIAILLIIIGLIGVLLPIVPGSIFIILAIIILYKEEPRIKDFIKSKLEKYPKINEHINKHAEKYPKIKKHIEKHLEKDEQK